jgi:hypothetical protein
VVFGATVDLEDEDSGVAVTYQIVGEDEADLKQGLINVSSPIARALIGKEEGDTAVVQARAASAATRWSRSSTSERGYRHACRHRCNTPSAAAGCPVVGKH